MNEAPQLSDDDVLAALETQETQRKADLAIVMKAANAAVARKLVELRATSGGDDLFAAGDSGGTFRGVFKAPTIELWKRWKSEFRTDQGKLVCNQNLVVGCMLWPAAEALAAAAAKRPALYDVLGIILQERAGSGQDALVKG